MLSQFINTGSTIFTPLTCNQNLTVNGTLNINDGGLTIAKINGLRSELDSKLSSNIYALPRTTSNWILLGSLTNILQNGQSAVFEFCGNSSFDGDAGDEYYATLRFCTSNNSGSTYVGLNGSAFWVKQQQLGL